MQTLQMTCSKCRVASTCPRSGSSPLTPPGSRRPVFCHIVGGYGRDPVDRAKLSASAQARSDRDGPCLTIAEIPALDEATKIVVRDTVTIYHQPVRHAREQAEMVATMLYPKSHKDGT